MNKDEEIEILEILSDDSHINKQNFSKTKVLQDSSDVLSKGEDISENQSINEAQSSIVSPLISKPNVVGTTANSPRISAEAILASTILQHQKPKNSFEQRENSDENQSNEVSDYSHNDEKQIFNTNSNKKFTPILLMILFVTLLGTIIFLPYSEKLFGKLFSKDNEVGEQTVTNGHLVCIMEGDDLTNSYRYTETYSFDNGEVESLKHEVLIQGNADYLNERNQQCQFLQQISSTFPGITVDCNLASEEMKESQFFNLSLFDSSSINATFTEAGGVTPNAKKGDNYKEVKRVMEISGYDCKIK